jgi:hypothetical protein
VGIATEDDGGGVNKPGCCIKLTATQEITPYKWVHPEEEK